MDSKFFSRLVDGVLLVLALAAAAVIVIGRIHDWEPSAVGNLVFTVGNLILLLAVLVASRSMRAARKTERQKATLAFLREYNNSPVVNEGAKILNANKKFLGDGDEQERIAVRDFLNYFELLAIGLKNGIYDEGLVRDAMATTIVRYYQRAEDFIRNIRLDKADVRKVAYAHFEKLALKIEDQMKKSG